MSEKLEQRDDGATGLVVAAAPTAEAIAKVDGKKSKPSNVSTPPKLSDHDLRS